MDRIKRHERAREVNDKPLGAGSDEAREMAANIIEEIFQTIQYVREPAVKEFLDALLDDTTLTAAFWYELFDEMLKGLNEIAYVGELAFERYELSGTRSYIKYARAWHRVLTKAKSLAVGAKSIAEMPKSLAAGNESVAEKAKSLEEAKKKGVVMEDMQSQMKSGEVDDYYVDNELLEYTLKTGDFIRCYLISAIQFAISMENKIVIEAINKNLGLKSKFDTLMRAIIDKKLPLPREYSLDEMLYVSRDGMPRVKVAKPPPTVHRLRNRNTRPFPREPQSVAAEEGIPATATAAAAATAAATAAAAALPNKATPANGPPPPFVSSRNEPQPVEADERIKHSMDEFNSLGNLNGNAPPFAAPRNEPQPVVGGARKTHRKRRRNRSRSRRSRSNRH